MIAATARLAGLLLLLAVPQAAALQPIVWMTAAELRQAFRGQTIRGAYVGGLQFVETYLPDGAILYEDERTTDTGRWSIWGRNFCTFYVTLNGACFHVRELSRNCYQVYVASHPETFLDEPRLRPWLVAQFWRDGEPSTCPSLPIA
jgi:hypothetical protein